MSTTHRFPDMYVSLFVPETGLEPVRPSLGKRFSYHTYFYISPLKFLAPYLSGCGLDHFFTILEILQVTHAPTSESHTDTESTVTLLSFHRIITLYFFGVLRISRNHSWVFLT